LLDLHDERLPAPAELLIEPFDGQNWERDAHTLARLSKEP